MRKVFLLLLLLAVVLAGCSSNVKTVHTKIPANNTIYFPNGFGVTYNWHGKVYLSLFHGKSPFEHAYTPAEITFVHGVLVKMRIGNKTYVPYKVSLQIPNSSGGFPSWKVVYINGHLVNSTS